MAAAEAAGGALGDDDEEPISLEALAAQLAALEAEEAEERRRRAKLEAEVCAWSCPSNNSCSWLLLD